MSEWLDLIDEPQEHSLGDMDAVLDEGREAGLTWNARVVIDSIDVTGQHLYHARFRAEYDEHQQILFLVIDE